jgi:hypothetical protein
LEFGLTHAGELLVNLNINSKPSLQVTLVGSIPFSICFFGGSVSPEIVDTGNSRTIKKIPIKIVCQFTFNIHYFD